MSSAAVPVITLDGPGGSGKGTVGQNLATVLGWHFLDSGALYRVLALAARRRAVALDDGAGLAVLAQALDVAFPAEGRALLDGQDITDEMRSEACGEWASQVARQPAVRDALLARQRDFRRPPGLVADGRDMGSVVFPDAKLKIFLTATPEVRARRRYKQLNDKGMDVNLAQVLQDIVQRDERDSARAIAPLKPAPDALVVDTSALSIAEVVERIRERM